MRLVLQSRQGDGSLHRSAPPPPLRHCHTAAVARTHLSLTAYASHAQATNHCRFCKCRGCKHCHGDLSLPDWATDAANASTKPLCLSVWRGEVYEGAPLVWARCRRDVTTHQRWAAEGGGGAGAAFALRHDPEGAPAGPPLCVAVPAPADLVAWAAQNTPLPL